MTNKKTEKVRRGHCQRTGEAKAGAGQREVAETQTYQTGAWPAHPPALRPWRYAGVIPEASQMHRPW